MTEAETTTTRSEKLVTSGPNTIRKFVDPVPLAREAGRHEGRREMRDLIRDKFATFAVNHPNPTVVDELWAFVDHIKGIEA